MFTKQSLLKVLGITTTLLIAATPPEAGAVASGTSVSNQATVNYQVGGIAQTAVNSNVVAFVVDKKVNLTVSTSDVAAVQVTPGATGVVLKFSVQNTGNDVQDFALTSTAVTTGGATKWGGATTDAFDATGVAIYVDSNANGTYDAGVDTATFIDELAAGASKTVFIVANIPAGATDGQYASYHLVAQARAGGGATVLGAALTETAGADTAGSVDTVFADTQGSDTVNDVARDAKHSSQDDYKVVTATLGVTKTSTVISDPINNTTNPKRIPGAVVEYTITISNTGTGTATSIAVSDSLNTEITNGNLAFNTQYNATAGKGISVAHPNYLAGAATEYTNASDGAEFGGVAADWNVTAANTVTVSGISLTNGQSATVKFRVTVQ